MEFSLTQAAFLNPELVGQQLRLHALKVFDISPNGFPVWGSYSLPRVASMGRMILLLSPLASPALGALGRMSLHLSPTCPHLSPALGALGRISLHLFCTCLPLWVPGAA